MIRVIIHGKAVPVTAVKGIDIKKVAASPRFRSWMHRLEPGILIQSVHFQSVDWFGDAVGFIKMHVLAKDPTGLVLPGVILLRGDSVTVFVVLECEGEEYAVFAAQARLAVGQLFFMEITGGMCDANGAFTSQAVLELEEELGIKIEAKDLVDLISHASKGATSSVFPSQGACDEALAIYLYRTTISRADLEHLKKYQGGVEKDGERTYARIVPLDDIFTATRNETAWLAYFLYKGLLKKAA